MSLVASPQFATLEPHTSDLTGRTVLVNLDGARYALRPNLSDAELRRRLAPRAVDLERTFDARVDALRRSRNWSQHRAQRESGLGTTMRALLTAPLHASTVDAFAQAFLTLVTLEEALAADPVAALRARLVAEELAALGSEDDLVEIARLVRARLDEALIWPWLAGVVAAPPAFFGSERLARHYGTYETGDARDMMDAHAFVLDVSRANYNPTVFALIHRRLLLSVLDARSAGDLDFGLLTKLYAVAAPPMGARDPRRPKLARAYAGPLLDLYRQAHAADPHASQSTLAALPASYSRAMRRRTLPGSDPTFAWASSLPTHTQAWVALCRAHLASRGDSLLLNDDIVMGRRLLRYVEANPTLPAPADLCLPGAESHAQRMQHDILAKTGKTTRARYAQLLRGFFDTAVETAPRLVGGHRDGRYSNPLAAKELAVRDTRGASKLSSKLPLPQRFVRLCKEIITAPGPDGLPFHWPKRLHDDYFTPPGGGEVVWSPVRSHLFLLRLCVPIRRFQAQMLDSGFGDYWAFDTATRAWVRNTGPHAPRTEVAGAAQGLLRRMTDTQSGRQFTGLHITTNKTADRVAGFENPGYDIPFADEEVIDLFCRVRDFQEQYAAHARPITRADLPGQTVSDKLKSKLRPIFPLFRDLAHPQHPDLPVSDGRLNQFWLALLEAVEQRLWDDGVRNDDGTKVQLLGPPNHRGQRKPYYTGHSLRLSGVTRLLMAGLPLDIVSAIVGHSSIVMTLVYHKPSGEYIQQQIRDAEARLLDAERLEFEAILRGDPSGEVARKIIVANSEYAPEMLAEVQSSAWGTFDAFLCPNGATLCNEGGPLLEASGGRPKYGPVPGPARNCALCRFACTTPAHLPALVAQWNALMGRIRSLEGELTQKTAKRREAEAEAALARRTGGTPPDRRRVDRLNEAVDRLNEDIAVLSETLVALTTLIARAQERLAVWMEARRAMAHGAAEDEAKFPLILRGTMQDLEVSFRQVRDFELWSRICEDAEAYESIDPQLPAHKRARLLDAMLARNGHQPLMIALTEEQLVSVGNAAVAFLRTRLGAAGMVRAIDGDELLPDEVVEELGQLIHQQELAAAGQGLRALAPPVPAPMRRLPAAPSSVR